VRARESWSSGSAHAPSKRRPRSLIVDDDPDIHRLIRSLLGKSFDSRDAESGAAALKILEDWPADLIILDLVMHGIDGFVVCQRVREQSAVPILVLSARQDEADKVRALDLGADDYLTKPFSRDELMARIRALLRRSIQKVVTPPPYDDGYLRIDFGYRQVLVNGQETHMTPTEFALVDELARTPGNLLAHASLLQRIWGPEYRNEIDYLRVYVRRIRRKIEPDPRNPRYIITETRVGYRFRSRN
jgi:two-component system KDP operon response regulator KdpE